MYVYIYILYRKKGWEREVLCCIVLNVTTYENLCCVETCSKF